VIHSGLRAGRLCPAAGPGRGPAPNWPRIACLAAELPGRDWREDASRPAGDVRDQVGAW